MSENKVVCIGMPVYNGEKYIRTAINAILKQDYENFTLIISDNGSTDSTAQICREYVAKDPRVKFFKTEMNQGAVYNFMKVFELADPCDYFAWCAHDDLWHRTYLSKCLEKMEANPEAILCCSQVSFIDLAGNIMRDKKDDIRTFGIETVGMTVTERLRDLMVRCCWCIIFGLFRYDALKKAGPLPNIYGSDVVFLAKLILMGDVVKIPENLFYYRYVDRSLEDYFETLSLVNHPSTEKPFTNMAIEIMKVIYNSDLDIKVKTELREEFVELVTKFPFWIGKMMSETSDTNIQTKLFVKGLLVLPALDEKIAGN